MMDLSDQVYNDENLQRLWLTYQVIGGEFDFPLFNHVTNPETDLNGFFEKLEELEKLNEKENRINEEIYNSILEQYEFLEHEDNSNVEISAREWLNNLNSIKKITSQFHDSINRMEKANVFKETKNLNSNSSFDNYQLTGFGRMVKAQTQEALILADENSLNESQLGSIYSTLGYPAREASNSAIPEVLMTLHLVYNDEDVPDSYLDALAEIDELLLVDDENNQKKLLEVDHEVDIPSYVRHFGGIDTDPYNVENIDSEKISLTEFGREIYRMVEQDYEIFERWENEYEN